MVCGRVDWIHLAQDTFEWHAALKEGKKSLDFHKIYRPHKRLSASQEAGLLYSLNRPHKRLSAPQEAGLLYSLNLVNLMSTYRKMSLLPVALSRKLKHL